MNMSTMMMPCNTTGWFDAQLAAKYGIADFVRPHLAMGPFPHPRSLSPDLAQDWSNVRDSAWAVSRPMDDGARLIQQAAMVKAVNPRTHVWVYRAAPPLPAGPPPLFFAP